jgi:hypothetical protein
VLALSHDSKAGFLQGADRVLVIDAGKLGHR